MVRERRKGNGRRTGTSRKDVARNEDEVEQEFILLRKLFVEGPRYLLQEIRRDASKPYYLTQRIFVSRDKAVQALLSARRTGQID
jgi:hypothetical protein